MSSTRERRFDAVLFDWDDTLCGATPHRYGHAQEVARRFGVELSVLDVYRACARAEQTMTFSWTEFVERLPHELELAHEHHAAFIDGYLARDAWKTFQLFDGVLEVVEHIGRHNLRVGVLSNNGEVMRHVERMDVQHRFEIVVSPNTYGVSKPDPLIFTRTAEQLGVAPERTIYVGDSYDNDVIGARAAGMTPVLVNHYGIELDDHDAEHRIASLSAFATLLDDLLYAD